jgi:hypothetical protein
VENRLDLTIEKAGGKKNGGFCPFLCIFLTCPGDGKPRTKPGTGNGKRKGKRKTGDAA